MVQSVHDPLELLVRRLHGNHHPHGGDQLKEDGFAHRMKEAAEELMVAIAAFGHVQVSGNEGGQDRVFLNVIHEVLQPFGAKNVVAEGQHGCQFANHTETHARNGLLKGFCGELPSEEHGVGKSENVAGEGLVALHQGGNGLEILIPMRKFSDQLGSNDG